LDTGFLWGIVGRFMAIDQLVVVSVCPVASGKMSFLSESHALSG